MKFAHRAEYPATPDAVFAVLRDPAFQEAKGEATTSGRWSADVTTSGDRTVITTERHLPTDRLPDMARSFVGETLTVVEVQTWGPADADGSRRADLSLHVKGAPMTLKGWVRLSPSGAATLHEVEADLRAGVPLLGGRLEKAAAEPLAAAAAIETDLLHQRLG